MAKEDITTIQVSKETREELKNLGKKGQTYDEIIQKLVRHAKGCTQEEK